MHHTDSTGLKVDGEGGRILEADVQSIKQNVT